MASEKFRGFIGIKSPTAEGLVKRFFAGEDDFAFSVAVVLQETDGARVYRNATHRFPIYDLGNHKLRIV